MPRTITVEAPQIPVSHNYWNEDLTVQLITPLLGGGVQPRRSDLQRVIRPTVIRGHLRMWWRSLQTAIIDPDTLRTAESAVWGDTSQPSQVEIETELISPGRALNRQEVTQLGIAPNNWLFPILQGDVANVRAGVEFRLRLKYPEQFRRDVRIPLRYWLNFGGIGSRTRRGCGALYEPNHAIRELQNVATDFPNLEEAGNWPKAPGRILVQGPLPDSLTSWRRAIDTYRQFRGLGLVAARDFNEMGGIQPRRMTPMILRPLQLNDGTCYAAMILLMVGSTATNVRRLVLDHFLQQGNFLVRRPI